jgi:peptide/nickel transport system permease protein
MTDFASYALRRVLYVPLSLLVITAVLYGVIMISPPEERAALYFPPNTPSIMTEEKFQATVNDIIAEYHLDDPYPLQYGRWLVNLLRGDWGWSPTFNEEVIVLLKARAPVTLELTIFSLFLLIPLALLSGLIAGWSPGSRTDGLYRFAAFFATAVPPFILGLFLLSILYVGLHWFEPGRSSIRDINMARSTFQDYTGLLTVDGILNGRWDVTLDALQHLVLPVFTLSLLHWATISRVTRVAVLEEKDKDYITAARSRGLRRRSLAGRHALRNALLPALTTSVLSAAAIVTGVLVVEVVFNLKGLSELVARGMANVPDAPLSLGFAVFAVLLILPIMVILDLVKGMIDPRIREGSD